MKDLSPETDYWAVPDSITPKVEWPVYRELREMSFEIDRKVPVIVLRDVE